MTALVAADSTLADAVLHVAADDGKQDGTVRGNYYTHRRKLIDALDAARDLVCT